MYEKKEPYLTFYPIQLKFLPGWGSGQYGPYGDPAGPGTPAQGEPEARIKKAGSFSVGNPGPHF